MKVILLISLHFISLLKVLAYPPDTIRGKVTYHTPSNKGCPKFGNLCHQPVMLKCTDGKLIGKTITDSLGEFYFILPDETDSIHGIIIELGRPAKPKKSAYIDYRYKPSKLRVYQFNARIEMLTEIRARVKGGKLL